MASALKCPLWVEHLWVRIGPAKSNRPRRFDFPIVDAHQVQKLKVHGTEAATLGSVAEEEGCRKRQGATLAIVSTRLLFRLCVRVTAHGVEARDP